MQSREFWNKQYTLGYMDALYDFAHWKDGEMFVGNCGTKYKKITQEVESKALCLHMENTWKYQAVNVKKEKPAIMGWYGIVGDTKPENMGRCFYNGKEFEFSKMQIPVADLLNNNTDLFWLKRVE